MICFASPEEQASNEAYDEVQAYGIAVTLFSTAGSSINNESVLAKFLPLKAFARELLSAQAFATLRKKCLKEDFCDSEEDGISEQRDVHEFIRCSPPGSKVTELT